MRRLGRARRPHGDVPAGAFVEVLPSALVGFEVLASCDDPREEVRSGWLLWVRTGAEVGEVLGAMDVGWLEPEGTARSRWPVERLRLLAPASVLRTPWSGLASASLWGIVVALACVVVWFQDVPAWPPITAIVGTWLALSVRRITASLTLDDDGVTVRNTWRSWRLSWADIEAAGTSTPWSVWNVQLTMNLQAVAFRVRGRRSLLQAAGTATLSGNRLIEAYAAVRPWCQAAGVPAATTLGTVDSPVEPSR